MAKLGLSAEQKIQDFFYLINQILLACYHINKFPWLMLITLEQFIIYKRWKFRNGLRLRPGGKQVENCLLSALLSPKDASPQNWDEICFSFSYWIFWGWVEPSLQYVLLPHCQWLRYPVSDCSDCWLVSYMPEQPGAR